MPRILITGSASGLGLLAARDLANRGHEIYLQARSSSRAAEAKAACPTAQGCLVGDLSSLADLHSLAAQINALAPWDAIIHSAGVMHNVAQKRAPEGYGLLFATNTVAPYVLTSLVGPARCRRFVFLASSMASGGDVDLRGLENCSYSDSKLHNVMLAGFFARVWEGRGVFGEANVLDPGWVPTDMGGRGAPGKLEDSVETYRVLAEGSGGSGEYWGPGARRGKSIMKEAWEERRQERLVMELERVSGVKVEK